MLEEAAVCLARAGDVDTARQTLVEAAKLYDDMAAVTNLRRLQARLRPYGVRLGPRSAHRTARTGWESLTPAELTVVAEIALGHSNTEIAGRLFLSRRTVETHVSHILSKLQVGSRLDVFRPARDHIPHPPRTRSSTTQSTAEAR